MQCDTVWIGARLAKMTGSGRAAGKRRDRARVPTTIETLTKIMKAARAFSLRGSLNP